MNDGSLQNTSRGPFATAFSGAARFSGRGWARVRRVRSADGADETGLHKMFDLHALSCAGDALVAVGLAGTIFFSVPVGEARTRVALYLLITMAPFALLAPLVGPVLDRFRHGRRYALATTMLARGFLAYAIADQLDTWVLYPAAFGVLVMSKSYGVARSAAVPRLLPSRITLVEANARGSLAGTIFGGIAGAVGAALAMFGPGWPLRLATVVFFVGMVLSLRLPAGVDSDRPEVPPRVFALLAHKEALRLWNLPVWAAVTAGGTLRAVFGFLALFMAFRVREDDLLLEPLAALGAVAAALAIGSFVATLIGSRLKLRRPLLLDAIAVSAVALGAAVAAVFYSLPVLVALAFGTALASSLAKLAVDAVIQERLPDESRASAFAHSETMIQLAWVSGGAVGLIPLSGQWGLFLVALVVAAVAVRVGAWAWAAHRAAVAPITAPANEWTSPAGVR
ncbi:MFS transporter [Cryptosporangium aurantiacum]|uniref:Major Facilitator Superfamily protein n=1 Tax=Cryptosporangium aurantiacum TaxID=134849 RepID=A0A1M7N0S9_9ACTN|nr:MFS transporter [Cryptosporangium aurantiacum]SHM97008.1 Major Facilitator Superfamily protein [Cryptosporangium aurantiacum]